jgi:hypothetical protein
VKPALSVAVESAPTHKVERLGPASGPCAHGDAHDHATLRLSHQPQGRETFEDAEAPSSLTSVRRLP